MQCPGGKCLKKRTLDMVVNGLNYETSLESLKIIRREEDVNDQSIKTQCLRSEQPDKVQPQ